jgi:phosphate starvation-inducible PhoH-like protein
MKMFLTRLGMGSRMVVTGDITQIDLPKGFKSGLVEASEVLSKIKEIDFIKFKDVDVVRHSLVRKIARAYEKNAIQS